MFVKCCKIKRKKLKVFKSRNSKNHVESEHTFKSAYEGSGILKDDSNPIVNMLEHLIILTDRLQKKSHSYKHETMTTPRGGKIVPNLDEKGGRFKKRNKNNKPVKLLIAG